jgi:hypothetical protein
VVIISFLMVLGFAAVMMWLVSRMDKPNEAAKPDAPKPASRKREKYVRKPAKVYTKKSRAPSIFGQIRVDAYLHDRALRRQNPEPLRPSRQVVRHEAFHALMRKKYHKCGYGRWTWQGLLQPRYYPSDQRSRRDRREAARMELKARWRG